MCIHDTYEFLNNIYDVNIWDKSYKLYKNELANKEIYLC